MDGFAVSNAADDKHERYPASGGDLVPLAFEAGGRPGEETIAFVRSPQSAQKSSGTPGSNLA